VRSPFPGLLAAAFLAASTALGQEVRASLEGTVKDATGAVIAEAAVEARSAAGAIVPAATDGGGRYRFPSLLPGRYQVSARRAGFSPAAVGGVELALGQILQVDLSLPLAGVAEKVTVTSEAPLIDVTQSSRFVSIRGDHITKLPRGRDYTSLLSLAPGVNPSGHAAFRGLSVDGSSGSENRYVVDGIDTTHILEGYAALGVVTEALDEVQVKSSGYPAEYGGATGGVINVITRSGANRWTGEAGFHYTGDWLQGRPRPFLLQDPSTGEATSPRFPNDSFDRWEPTVSLGGPLRKDVAWFFASLSPAVTSSERTLTFHPSELVGTFSSQVRAYNANVNVTAQLGPKTRARLAFNASPATNDGSLPAKHGLGNPLSNYDIETFRPSHAASGNVDYLAAHNLLLSARAGYWYANTRDEGVFQGHRYLFGTSNIGMAGVPAELQGARFNTNTFSNLETTRNVFERLSGQVDGTLYVSGAGRHALKAGLQVERLHNDVAQGQTGNGVTLNWDQAYLGQRGQFGYYTVNSNGVFPERGTLTEGDVRSHNLAVFIQDAWTIRDRLTLNLGLRAEKESVPAYTSAYGIGSTAFDFGFAQKLAPRVGAAWDVKGDGRWKVYGSWGFFYDQMKYVLALQRFGGFKFLRYSYTLDTPDWPNLMRPGCPPACPGTLIEGPIDFARPANIPGESAIDPDLDPTRLQEAVLGGEHQLTRTISVGARYVHRQIDQALDDIGTRDAEGNEVYTIGNPGFGRAAETGFGPAMPKVVRDYDALELTFDKRMAHRWSLRASYLLSRLYGNYSGLSEGGEGQPAANLNGAFNNPIKMFGADGQPILGILDNDRTHQFKAHAIYDFPFGTTLSTSVKVLSGLPVTRYGYFVVGRRYSVPYAGLGSDGRMPALGQLDAYVQHEFRLSGPKRLQLAINVLNLLDAETPFLRYAVEFQNAININEADYFRGFDVQQLIASQQLARDPLFLKDYGFQEAREVRLSLKIVF
jgi:hypothetical protein